MITRTNIQNVQRYSINEKYILNSSVLDNFREVTKYNKIEIKNNFTNSVVVIESDNSFIDIEKLIFYASKDIPYSKIIIDGAHEKANTLQINILPLLTTA